MGGSVAVPLVTMIRHVMQGKPVVFIDVSKAYDKIDRNMIRLILRARGIAFDHAFKDLIT